MHSFIKSTAKETIDRRRRSLLMNAIGLSFGVALANTAHSQTTICVDPDDLSGAQRSLRKAAEYQDTYSDEKKTCRHCEFFKSRESNCGDCQALGGPVSAGGHCASWSARA